MLELICTCEFFKETENNHTLSQSSHVSVMAYFSKLVMEHSVKFEVLSVVVHVLQTTQNLVISRCCFVEDGKEMY